MREYTSPSDHSVESGENLSDFVFSNAEQFPDTVSFRRREGSSWHDVTAREFATEVTEVAKGLVNSGIAAGDRIGLMSKTRYEWTLLDFAIWTAGAVTVPIYETSSSDQMHWILSDSGARGLLVETPEHTAILNEIRDQLPELKHAWQIEPAPTASTNPTDKPAVAQLREAASGLSDDELRERRRSVRADDMATIVYTSGTTGRPKGVVLTHRNLLAEIRADLAAFPHLMEEGNSLLTFLPLAHVLARAIALGAVAGRVTLGHTPDISNLLDDLASFQPSYVVAVPRVFEKVYNSARLKAHSEGKGKIFDAAERTAVAYSEATTSSADVSPGIVLRAKHAVFDKLVYAKLRATLGNRCQAAISGGAPLAGRLAHFFRGIGIPVFEGYGLTETSAAANVNTPDAIKVGTVGRPVGGTSVRIAEDGEILLSGDVVFTRYWNNEAATAESLEDGWFHTGDVGTLDDEGFLSITGRKKEIIVTAGGKNVAPSGLEDQLKTHPLISQAMVVGDQRPFIGVLITVDEEFLPGWKTRNGKPEDATVADLSADADLRAEIQAAIDDANTTVSHAEAIKKFSILPRDFTEAGGEITPSLKLKRNVVSDNHSSQIEALYTK